MGIGSGIFLFVIGAILTFALNVETSVINLDLVGYILMGAGVLVFLISLFMTMRRRSVSTETRTAVDPNSGQRVTRSDTNDTL